MIMMLLTWVVSAAFHAPYFYIFKLLDVNSEVYCIATWEPAFEDPATGKLYMKFFCVLFILIPLSLIGGIYTVIVVVLLRQRNAMRGEVRGGISRDKMYKNVLKMGVIICVIFAICWAPVNINVLLFIFEPNSKNVWCTPHAFTFTFTAEFLVFANTAFNPFVYFGFLRNNRRSLRATISGLFLQSRIRNSFDRFTPKRRETFELTSIPCDEAGSVQVVSSKKLHTAFEGKVGVAEGEQHQSISLG